MLTEAGRLRLLNLQLSSKLTPTAVSSGLEQRALVEESTQSNP